MYTKPVLAGTTVFLAAGLLQAEASASEFEVALSSSYVDTVTFNEQFSEEPLLKITGSFDLSEHTYFEAYGYTGFDKPFGDQSSEYGFEVGAQWDVGEQSSIKLAAGRWMNYAGEGADVGDWFVSARAEVYDIYASVSALSGDSDTVVYNLGYEISFTDDLSLSPSVSYLSEEDRFNPGITAEYALTDSLAISGQLVYPEDEEGERELYGAVSIAWHWGA